MSNQYVLGFLFSPNFSNVVLIRKNKPDWQKDKLNGVGGKVEDFDKCLEDAMIREFKEETGLEHTDWTIFAKLICSNGDGIYVFHGISDKVYELKSMTDEEVNTYSVKYLLSSYNQYPIIPNLKWLLPMALDTELNFTNVLYEQK